MQKLSSIFIPGHTGLVGSALMRELAHKGYTNLITRTPAELDLRRQHDVEQFFAHTRPEYVFLCAAKVGGIKANMTQPADFIYDNLLIQTNIIHAAHTYGVKKLLFFGSSCIYPRTCPQPIKEEYLLTAPLEQTNEWYAVAKIAGIKMCQAYNKQHGTRFIACMPTNLYGPHDNFDPENSHVIPGLIAKMYAAKKEKKNAVHLWGTGKPMREFLYVDDLARAALFLMENYEESEIINVGSGADISIAELAHMIKKIVGFEGELIFDHSVADGTPRKLLDVSNINALGWCAEVGLAEGIERTVEWYFNFVSYKQDTKKQGITRLFRANTAL